jgi:transposase-like protein
MNCVQCNSLNVKKNGKYKFCYQKYKCLNCGKQFSERSFSFFNRHRFPDEVIRNTVLLLMFVSARMAKFYMQETLQFKFSHVSAFNWAKKFALYSRKFQRTESFSNVWHVDEKFVKVKGSKDDFAYLWVVIDDKNSMIATYVSNSRNIISAKAVLRKAKMRAKKPPDIIVTDGLQAYKKACKNVFGRKTKHVVRHFESKAVMHQKKLYWLSNNRIESLNSKINLWYKKFRGFKSLKSANLWCEMWQHFYNLIRPRTTPHKIISIQQILN